jgi:eukaryotic-like serine/threonine-protein kinase
MASEYRLTGRLEAGELAELYRAEKVGGPQVIVKLFHPRTTTAVYAREIAETQNRLLKLTNPGIAQVIDIGLVKDRLAIIREDRGRYTLGMALQRLNTKEIVIMPALAMVLVIDLLEAVADAHSQGVIHGALTPGNVLLSDVGRAAICDFGALAALNASPALRKNFAARGRSSYRAPEITKGDPLSVQADVYSLGAMTYELLTLKEPMTGTVSTRREVPPAPSRVDRRLNSRIDPIVMRALDPAPGRRYKTTNEFAGALREMFTYSGGLPSRDELAKFTAQLFPNEMQVVEPTGNVPFDSVFSLSPVEGASLDEADEASMVVAERKSFSGGTLDNLEAVDPARPTIQMEAVAAPETTPITDLGDRPRETNWHAPPAAMPATARSGNKEPVNPEIMRRMRIIEDFAGGDNTDPEGNPTPKEKERDRDKAKDDAPRPFAGKNEKTDKTDKPHMTPAQRADERAKHVATPAESQPLEGKDVIVTPDGKRRKMITEERNIRAMENAWRKWIPLVAGSALLALAFLFFGMWRWSSTDAVQDVDAPARPPPRPHPLVTKQTTREAPKPPPALPPGVKNCYAAPKGGTVGYIGVAADRPIWVAIDGDTVCSGHQKVTVSPGIHRVTVTDSRTGEEYVHTGRVDAKQVYPVVPTFRGH